MLQTTTKLIMILNCASEITSFRRYSNSSILWYV